MARRKRSTLDRMAFHMKPNRVLARYLSGGRHQTFKSIAKSPFKERTVHTAKSGRHAYQQQMARERKARAATAARQRKQAVADQRGARAQMRQQQPKPPRTSRQPIAVDPRTGKPITWAQAQKAARDANARADRLAAGHDGDAPARRPRRPKPEPATPLARAIAEVQKNKKKPAKPAPKKQPRKKPTSAKRATAKRRPAKKGKGVAATVADLIPGQAILAATMPGRDTPGAGPKPVNPRTRASRTARRGIYGEVLKRTCECGGTGRIPIYNNQGDPAGSTSCPEHGRAGDARGAKRWTAKRAIRDSGLPGLGAWLEKRRTKKRGNSDARQHRAWELAQGELRMAGPTLECEWCEDGLVNRQLTDRLRKQHIMKARADAAALIRAAQAHNAEVADTGEGRQVKVPKMPTEKQLQTDARRTFPYDHCSVCKGLGRVATGVRLLQDGSQPVAEWRAAAGLKDGHRSTARQRSTGRRPTENAARVERRRIVPRL
jgi:hypothetical protein